MEYAIATMLWLTSCNSLETAQQLPWSALQVDKVSFSMNQSDVAMPWVYGAQGLLVGAQRVRTDVLREGNGTRRIVVNFGRGFASTGVEFIVSPNLDEAGLPLIHAQARANWDVSQDGVSSESMIICSGHIQLSDSVPQAMFFYLTVKVMKRASGPPAPGVEFPIIGMLPLEEG